MVRRWASVAAAGIICLLLVAIPSVLYSFANGQAASLVIGQSSFVANGQATTASGLYFPTGLGFDSAGNLWTVDYYNNRVLEYPVPFANGESASLVIGQSNFTSRAPTSPSPTAKNLFEPDFLAFDKSGNLWVSDGADDRVLEYTPPFVTGESASLVIGEPDFTTAGEQSPTASSLAVPQGLAFDKSGNLWVADHGNNRVLEYAAPFTTGESASTVIGQAGFNSSTSHSTPTASSLSGPVALAFDSGGNLWVVDTGDVRVLEFASPLATGESASLVLGQPSFSSRAGFNSGILPPAASLQEPYGLAFDGNGNLWVSDGGDNRVLEYTAPFATAESASVVIGQPNFAGNTPPNPPTSSSLNAPWGVAFGSSGGLWVADSGNNRVLEYSTIPVTTTTLSRTVTATVTATSVVTSTSTTTIRTTSMLTSTATSIISTKSTVTVTATTATTSTFMETATATSTGTGGIPEFPYQALTVALFAAVIVSVYFAARRRAFVQRSRRVTSQRAS